MHILFNIQGEQILIHKFMEDFYNFDACVFFLMCITSEYNGFKMFLVLPMILELLN